MKNLMKKMGLSLLASSTLMSSLALAVENKSSLKLPANTPKIFQQTVAHLDVGGEQFSYSILEHENAFSELYKDIQAMMIWGAKLNELKDEMQGSELDTLMSLEKNIYSDLGIYELQTLGSSTVKDGDNFLQRTFMLANKAYTNKDLYALLGGEAKPLQLAQALPKNTLFACSMRANPVVIKDSLQRLMKNLQPLMTSKSDKAQFVEFKKQLDSLPQLLKKFGLEEQALFKELNTEFGLIISADENQQVKINELGEMPLVRAHVLIANPGPQLRKLAQLIAKETKMAKAEIAGSSLAFALAEACPVTKTSAGIVDTGKWLVLSTDLEDAVNLGKKSSAPSDFKELSKDFPSAGNAFVYLSSKRSESLMQWAGQAADKRIPTAQRELIGNSIPQILQMMKGKVGMASILAFDAEGISMISRTKNNTNISASPLTAVAVTGVLAAMILPALGKARKKAAQHKSMSDDIEKGQQ